MIQTIEKVLSGLSVANYIIRDTKSESAELFFVRRNLDMRRMTDIHEYNVIVYADVKREDGEALRGSSSVTLNPGMTEEQIRASLSDAYAAAGYAGNPYYELADPVKEPFKADASALGKVTVFEAAQTMANAIFKADTALDAFVNSAEVFAVRKTVRIVTSWGTDVSYSMGEVNGEYVSQCKTDSADVETHRSFRYSDLDPDSLTEAVANALSRVRDRAEAKPGLASGNYDVILSDRLMPELISYFAERSDAAMIYPGYSNFKVGEPVAPEGNGEKINLSLVPTVPYSVEGIPMIYRRQIEGSVLKQITGSLRFCRYLGTEPTGNYEAMELDNGTLPMEKLLSGKCLHVVAFSDFQTDAMSGHFGGEIRLAYLYEDGKVTKVTGGSVNGSILDASGNLVFSTEKYSDANYTGPRAVRIPNVPVAGC